MGCKGLCIYDFDTDNFPFKMFQFAHQWEECLLLTHTRMGIFLIVIKPTPTDQWVGYGSGNSTRERKYRPRPFYKFSFHSVSFKQSFPAEVELRRYCGTWWFMTLKEMGKKWCPWSLTGSLVQEKGHWTEEEGSKSGSHLALPFGADHNLKFPKPLFPNLMKRITSYTLQTSRVAVKITCLHVLLQNEKGFCKRHAF